MNRTNFPSSSPLENSFFFFYHTFCAYALLPLVGMIKKKEKRDRNDELRLRMEHQTEEDGSLPDGQGKRGEI